MMDTASHEIAAKYDLLARLAAPAAAAAAPAVAKIGNGDGNGAKPA